MKKWFKLVIRQYKLYKLGVPIQKEFLGIFDFLEENVSNLSITLQKDTTSPTFILHKDRKLIFQQIMSGDYNYSTLYASTIFMNELENIVNKNNINLKTTTDLVKLLSVACRHHDIKGRVSMLTLSSHEVDEYGKLF